MSVTASGGSLVVSLDLELYWGVCDAQSVESYGPNIRGVRAAIPAMPDTFDRHGISATSATVGMVMCKDYEHWRSVRPTVYPAYGDPGLSNYRLDALVTNEPDLFFAQDLVRRIADTPLQHVGSHTYSHCAAPGGDGDQFDADLACAEHLSLELRLQCKSFVFPRNQVVPGCLPLLDRRGYKVFRRNPGRWLYRDGHRVRGESAGRAMRLLDAYVPLRSEVGSVAVTEGGLTNVPATVFLRPWSRRLNHLEALRLARICRKMTAAAGAGRVYHLWWRPHNLGLHTERNLLMLDEILRHFQSLRERYGMRSVAMEHFS